ncbi:unnamed protein product [Cylindrotheca closterium]|uniref:CRAL-TRIO domain-containing protein n=1 Tax=Cylindrotheca closterium TaxID=2856 RepID=A0AAD2PXT2_9STRA|nr:unnamed protein product [Cylindrotheca closterium]
MLKLTLKTRRSGHHASEASSIDTSFASSDDLMLARPESFNVKNHFSPKELECIEQLSAACFSENRHVSNELIIRYAVYHNFNYGKAKDAIDKGYTYSYLYLELEGELLRYVMNSMVCFPLSGLKSRKTGSEVFYFHPSRYIPTSRNNHLLLDNMCYVLNDMSRTIDQCRNGVVMIVNMEGYSMKNFHNDTQMKMTRITEGHVVPTRIVDILIVNPPKFFKRLWKVVKPAFSKTYKKRIHIISNDKLGNYLMDGFEEYLPDEFMGWRSTQEMAIDYCDLKQYEERQQSPLSSSSS